MAKLKVQTKYTVYYVNVPQYICNDPPQGPRQTLSAQC